MGHLGVGTSGRTFSCRPVSRLGAQAAHRRRRALLEGRRKRALTLKFVVGGSKPGCGPTFVDEYDWMRRPTGLERMEFLRRRLPSSLPRVRLPCKPWR